MIAIKDMTEMPNACTSTQEILGDIGVVNCPLYNVCKHRDTINVNRKPADCPLTEIVTCKDCRHNKNGVCPNYRHFVDVDFYCGEGKKK